MRARLEIWEERSPGRGSSDDLRSLTLQSLLQLWTMYLTPLCRQSRHARGTIRQHSFSLAVESSPANLRLGFLVYPLTATTEFASIGWLSTTLFSIYPDMKTLQIDRPDFRLQNPIWTWLKTKTFVLELIGDHEGNHNRVLAVPTASTHHA